MSAPAKIKLSQIVFGDTWSGLLNCQVTSDGSATASELAEVRMFFRDGDGNLGLSLTTEDSTITITDAALWKFDINEIDEFPLGSGVWFWSIELTDVDGNRKTWISGTKEVLDDPTR